ncbi:MAG: hypothetical protein ACREOS_01455 [Candidatus Dormibacteraceae bacterium]
MLFGALVPLLIVLGIIWAIVAATRREPGEPFTLATAVALYARFGSIVTIAVGLGGIALAVKILISFIDPTYSYYALTCTAAPAGPYPNPCGTSDASFQRNQDLILAVVLIIAGSSLAAVHLGVGRAAGRLFGGAPNWIEGGSLVACTVIFGVLGIGGLISGLYNLLTRLFLGSGPNGSPGPVTFGDLLGFAIAFLPAWIVSLRLLLRRVDERGQRPAPA